MGLCPNKQWVRLPFLVDDAELHRRIDLFFMTRSNTDQQRVQAQAPVACCDSPFTPGTSHASPVDTYTELVASNFQANMQQLRLCLRSASRGTFGLT